MNWEPIEIYSRFVGGLKDESYEDYKMGEILNEEEKEGKPDCERFYKEKSTLHLYVERKE